MAKGDPRSVLDAVLDLYAQGAFPMADPHDPGKTNWYRPQLRAQMPLDKLHVSKKLKKLVRRESFDIRVDNAFPDVMMACMENRPGQWINDDIRTIFSALHRAGYAHSLECWKDDRLVGGVYGLALGGAFCAESMFSRVSGASKVALVHLCARLNRAGFSVLDCQMINDHTKQFGAYEIPDHEYRRRLAAALCHPGDFGLCRAPEDGQAVVMDYLNGAIS